MPTTEVTAEPLEGEESEELPTIRLSSQAQEIKTHASVLENDDVETGACVVAEQVATVRDNDLDFLSMRRVDHYHAKPAEFVSVHFARARTSQSLGAAGYCVMASRQSSSAFS